MKKLVVWEWDCLQKDSFVWCKKDGKNNIQLQIFIFDMREKDMLKVRFKLWMVEKRAVRGSEKINLEERFEKSKNFAKFYRIEVRNVDFTKHRIIRGK